MGGLKSSGAGELSPECGLLLYLLMRELVLGLVFPVAGLSAR